VRVSTIDPGFIGGTNMTNAIAGAAGSKPVMRKMPAKRGDPLAGGPPAGQEGKVAELAAAAPSLRAMAPPVPAAPASRWMGALRQQASVCLRPGQDGCAGGCDGRQGSRHVCHHGQDETLIDVLDSI